jgi:hypothetical protein
MTDTAKAEAFAGRMLGLLNGSFTALMVSVGHRTGLFDAMAQLPPSTSAQIASAAKLNERYVRDGKRRGRHRPVLPEGRRGSVREIRPLPGASGGGVAAAL